MRPARTKQQQIVDRVTERVATGRLREGERLPSEQQLARDHRVSLGTIQKALAQLSMSGILRREHGRGTFVSGNHFEPADVRYLQFRDTRGRTLPTFVRVLKTSRLRGPGPWARFLGQRACVRIDRLVEAGPRVRLASEFYLRAEDYAALGASGARVEGAGAAPTLDAGNLRTLLERRLALPTVRVEQLIRLAQPPVRSARLLGLSPTGPAFAMELYGYTVRDRPLFYQRVIAGPFADSLVILRNGRAATSPDHPQPHVRTT